MNIIDIQKLVFNKLIKLDKEMNEYIAGTAEHEKASAQFEVLAELHEVLINDIERAKGVKHDE